MTKSKAKILRSPVLAAVALLGIIGVSRSASAAVFTDSISNVQFSNGASGLLLTTTSNGYVQAILTSVTPCDNAPNGTLVATTLDTLKVWTSMAQSAVLSGKTLRIDMTTCQNGGRYITTMSLNK